MSLHGRIKEFRAKSKKTGLSEQTLYVLEIIEKQHNSFVSRLNSIEKQINNKSNKTPLIASGDGVLVSTSDAPSQTASYVQADVESIRVLANDLKAKLNILVTLCNDLKSKNKIHNR